jgi:hypothetical protein
MTGWLAAGGAHFAAVFAVAFGLGTTRVLLIAPLIGPVGAVLLEAPVVLAVSWIVCGRFTRAFGVSAAARPRLIMGGAAFALLMTAELALAVLAFGRTPEQYLAAMLTLQGGIGLLAQIGFALIPWLHGRRAAPRQPL